MPAAHQSPPTTAVGSQSSDSSTSSTISISHDSTAAPVRHATASTAEAEAAVSLPSEASGSGSAKLPISVITSSSSVVKSKHKNLRNAKLSANLLQVTTHPNECLVSEGPPPASHLHHNQSANSQTQPISSADYQSTASAQHGGSSRISKSSEKTPLLTAPAGRPQVVYNTATHQYHSNSVESLLQGVRRAGGIASRMTHKSESSKDGDDGSSNGGDGTKLKKQLGLVNGVSIIVGIIVGSGIFVSPKGVLQDTGSLGLSLVVWISCGVLSTIGALCYAELGVSIPESGGDYAYIRTAFGPLPAFLFLWAATMIIMPAGNAIAALTFANYILRPIFPDCTPPQETVRMLAALVICLLTFVNCYNVKWATFVQNYFTLAKVIALLIIIIAGLYWLIAGNTENFSDPWTGTSTSPTYVAKSFYSGLFSYAGWNYLNFVVEELKSPYKNLPRAIVISLPMVTLIYVFANVAYFAVLTQAEILGSDAVAVDFGLKILGWASWIMPLSVALSAFGGLNGGIFASSRLFFVGARRGHLPTALTMVNTQVHTPMPSLLLLGVISLAYLTTTQVYQLIDYTAFIESLFCTFSVAALLWLRYKRPDLERPIKVNIALPVFFLLVCLFLVLLPIFISPFETGMGALITLSGIPVYMVTIYWESKPEVYRKFMMKVTHLTQKLTLSVPEAAH